MPMVPETYGMCAPTFAPTGIKAPRQQRNLLTGPGPTYLGHDRSSSLIHFAALVVSARQRPGLLHV